jgi:hypothetical protein
MTLEGDNECANRALKCPFTPKGTFGHCQPPTVAQNTGTVPPFPTPNSPWLPPLTGFPGGLCLARRALRPRDRASGPQPGPRSASAHSGSVERCRSGPSAMGPSWRADVPAEPGRRRLGALSTLASALSDQSRATRGLSRPRNRSGCPLCARHISPPAMPATKTVVNERLISLVSARKCTLA